MRFHARCPQCDGPLRPGQTGVTACPVCGPVTIPHSGGTAARSLGVGRRTPPIVFGIGGLFALAGGMVLVAALRMEGPASSGQRPGDGKGKVELGNATLAPPETIDLPPGWLRRGELANLTSGGVILEPDGSPAIPVRSGLSSTIYFPGGRSKFVAVGGLDRSIEVWDAHDYRLIGALPSDPKFLGNFTMTLAPDGSRFAGYWDGDVFVHQVGEGDEVRLPIGEDLVPDRIEFAAKTGHLWVLVRHLDGPEIGSRSEEAIVQVWDILGGRKLSETAVPETVRSESVAVDAEQKRLAFTGSRHLWVIAPTNGQVLAKVPLSAGHGSPLNVHCRALAFSPDGRELAGVFASDGASSRLVTLDLAEPSEPTRVHRLAEPLFRDNSRHWLQYLPDGEAWLVGHDQVIARDTGRTLLSLSGANKTPGQAPRRVLDNGIILEYRDQGGPARLSGFRIQESL